MNNKPRKREPDRVRQALLDCAAKLAAEEGLAGITIQAVASAAGVTKGGLFHHFPNKQALIDSMIDEMMARLDAAIESFLSDDNSTYGCFTRAYVQAVLADNRFEPDQPWGAALPLAIIADPSAILRWDAWLAARLQFHAETDSDSQLMVVRLAADGAWFDSMLGRNKKPEYFPALLGQLIGMTQLASLATHEKNDANKSDKTQR